MLFLVVSDAHPPRSSNLQMYYRTAKGLDMFEQIKGLEMGRPSWITQMGLMGPMRVPLRSKQESQRQKETTGQGKQVLE